MGVRAEKRQSPHVERLSTFAGTPAALFGLKLATGNMHLVQGGRDPSRQHAGAVGEQEEALLVSHDAFIDTAPVTLALVIDLWSR